MWMLIKELAKTSDSSNHIKWSDFVMLNIENKINAYFKESVAVIADSNKVVNKSCSSYDIPQQIILNNK